MDQLVKIFVIDKLYKSSIIIFDNLLNLTYVENTGGAFGIGSNSTIMFIIVNIIVITLLAKFIISKANEINFRYINFYVSNYSRRARKSYR